ncbi:asparagine synthase (glutamine-hydrolyzing) [Vibrio rotiferianus]|uniref:asparagine synthase (glutamine-hydrolyzing) n=1 Tax=Vibrio rotiferianus TaxID=190895 RepID=UPI00148D6A77|nr:asparagine synthase (glutamine-hydrolyzing) [Vibrio rotiferianus]NOH65224.1 asparagine synthase (glutamine-hydrolyzing) [Vibrio rotiferianus]
MCGISAIFSPNGMKLEHLVNLNKRILHRGPDDEGYYLADWDNNSSKHLFGKTSPVETQQIFQLEDVDSSVSETGNVLLAHRRLAIRDVSARGHQPMTCYKQRFNIIYNGEVYNSDEIKSELVELGYHFESTTDTEIILYAFVEWKEKMLSKLNGMFSILIYDAQERSLFIARDRFGIKPLYYWPLQDGGYAFVSEIKQLQILPNWEAKLNHERAFDFLNWGQTDHTNETMFAGVLHLPPGHYAYLSAKNAHQTLKPIHWYNWDTPEFSGTFEEAVEKFKSLFVSSVDYRLKADVPIGTCLSGGLDSSSIVCVVNDLLQQKQVQKTFSSCSEHKRFDEREFVYEVLNKTKNIEPHLFNLEHKKFSSTLPKIIYHQDEPFLSPSVFAEWSVFETVSKNGVKVTLDGHGADEQLCGYHTFFGPMLYSLFAKGQWLQLVKEIKALNKLHGYGLGYSLPKIVRGILPDSMNQFLFKITNRPTKQVDWIDLDLLKVDTQNETAVPDVLDLKQLSFQQMTLHSLPKQLRWCDRDSMAFSVESRVPFVDYRVVEFLFSLPSTYKLEKGITKRVLRESMKNYLPTKVKDRIDKMGFVTPAEIWVKEEPEHYLQLIDSAVEKSKGILNQEAKNRLTRMVKGEQKFDHSFWRIIFFAEWMDTFKVEV